MRTTRKGVSREVWKRAQKNFCDKGKAFAKQFDTAGAAWKACDNGMFLAYWLVVILRVTTRGELLRLRRTIDPITDSVFLDLFIGENRAFAKQLKAIFRVDGTRK